MTVFYNEKNPGSFGSLPRLKLPPAEPIRRRALERNRSSKTSTNDTITVEDTVKHEQESDSKNGTKGEGSNWADRLQHLLNSKRIINHLLQEISSSAFKKEKLPMLREFNFTNYSEKQEKGEQSNQLFAGFQVYLICMKILDGALMCTGK